MSDEHSLDLDPPFFSREMAIKFLHSFVAAVLSTTTVLVNAQTSAPLQFAGVNIAGFGECNTTTVTCHT